MLKTTPPKLFKFKASYFTENSNNAIYNKSELFEIIYWMH